MDASTTPESARIAVVTVSYGSGSVIQGLLPSLAPAFDGPIVVIVVDNKASGSEDVADLARQYGARYLPMTSNVGYGSAVNAAICGLELNIDWVLIANPDLILGPGSLDVLVATADGDATIGAVGPLTLTSSGDPYPSARMVPSLRTGVGHALFANLWIDNPWSRAYKNDFAQDFVQRDAGWLSGSCVLVRRSLFDRIGGFDEGFFMYFEDVDLGYRIGEAGFRNVFEPAAVVTHAGAHSTNLESARMVAVHHDSAARFLNKKYSGAILWPLRFALRIGLGFRSAIVQRNLRRGLSD
jgi:N-acetylglucosaminyl-diphospho-decaprenol L-rhamnosyltransferase